MLFVGHPVLLHAMGPMSQGEGNAYSSLLVKNVTSSLRRPTSSFRKASSSLLMRSCSSFISSFRFWIWRSSEADEDVRFLSSGWDGALPTAGGRDGALLVVGVGDGALPEAGVGDGALPAGGGWLIAGTGGSEGAGEDGNLSTLIIASRTRTAPASPSSDVIVFCILKMKYNNVLKKGLQCDVVVIPLDCIQYK